MIVVEAWLVDWLKLPYITPTLTVRAWRPLLVGLVAIHTDRGVVHAANYRSGLRAPFDACAPLVA